MKVTVKRDERDTGLRRLWNSARGAQVRIDGKRVGSISHTAGRPGGWYFVVNAEAWNLAHLNTSDKPLDTYDEVKAAAIAHVKKHAKRVQQFKVEIPITGILTTTVYAADLAAAKERGLQSAKAVVANLPTVISWDVPTLPAATEQSGEPREKT